MAAVRHYVSSSPQETFAIGYTLGCRLPIPSIVYLFGDLAAGKTTLIKGLVSAAAAIEPEQVQSPTFNYLNIYSGKATIYHFDLYRFVSDEEFWQMGFDEFLETQAICCIEWTERLADHLIVPHWRIELVHRGGDCRAVTLTEVKDGASSPS